MRFVAALILIASVAPAQQATEGNPGDAAKTVTIKRVVVEGTRLSPLSVLHLAQIKAGDQVNFIKLHEAMQKVTRTGLIDNIDFEYESVPDSETDVVVHLKCRDVPATAKAIIEIPQVNEDDVWTWLTNVDKLFTREMPPTEAAIRLYATWIGKYMDNHGSPRFSDNYAIIAEGSAQKGSQVETLVFKPIKLKSAK